jgi:predicted PurR-regulated permease PerM
MVSLWEAALVLFLVVLTVLVIILIPTVLNFRNTLKRVSKLIENVNKELPDIMADINDITYRTNVASEKIDHIVNDVTNIEKKISAEIKDPLFELIGTLGGFFKAMQIFFTYFVKRKR